ncbi:hypothetical protein [Sphaerisporangium sp. NPDC051011]|uniref:hypothetical protein n=1 Tax=Sphaerisporangium sp. NPDC051011 TaxID=3155792 RepID=UPI0033E42093
MAEMILGILAACVIGSVGFTARSVPEGRRPGVRRRHLAWGLVLSVIGFLVMALTAWSTHEDQHYDDFGSAMTALAAMMGGALFLLGLGPVVSWLLGMLGRLTVRLPPPIRLAARDVAGDRARTAPAVAATMAATALAITIMIIVFAVTAQNRAGYHPQARPGTLLVHGLSPDEAPVVHAAVQRELPGVPIVQSDRQRNGHLSLEVENADLPDLENVSPAGLIGDRALLCYLTGDPSTPYAENTVVVVTAQDVDIDTVTVIYDSESSPKGGSLLEKSVPATVAKPADPDVEGVFIPAKVVRDLGLDLEPEQLIIDPSLHRTSAIEQARLDRRLGDTATTYVERGFQASTGWRMFVVAAVVVAFGCAFAGTGRAGGSRSRRVLLRVGGSTAIQRLFAACRVGLGAACGAVMGAAVGCTIGLLLAWPMTTSVDWDPMPRVGFDTPWLLIAALVIGLPVLAAALAGLLPVRTARVAPSESGGKG